jgi:hypothetical protein
MIRRKPAPAGETKPSPQGPLQEALTRIATTLREADERADRVLERLRKRERGHEVAAR